MAERRRDEHGFGVLVPLKPLATAKSRLSSLPDRLRRELVIAFAADTVTAAVACAEVRSVLVVTDDLELADLAGRLGAAAIPDTGPGLLNTSLVQGAAELVRRHPGVRPVALCGDLPCLTADDLGTALAAVPTGPAFVADLDEVGTTLYTAAWREFAPRFGAGSREAHRVTGAEEITAAPQSLRRDVDSPVALQDARRTGVGRHTASVLDAWQL